MHLAPGLLANDLIPIIHDIEYLFVHSWKRYFAKSLANSTNCSNGKASARICGESPKVANAAVATSNGQSAFNNFRNILRRWENPLFTTFTKMGITSGAKSGFSRRISLMQA